MKRILLAGLASLALLTAAAQETQDEWTGIGTGAYKPGLLDFYEDEYPELMPAAVYESTETHGKYKFVPDPGFVGTTPGSTPVVVYEIIVHADNPDKVWCEEATFFRGIMNLTVRHNVKEVTGNNNEANYGQLANGIITFSTPNSFQVVDMMGPKNSNINGKFTLYMPGSAPGEDPIINDTWEVMGNGKYVEGILDCEYKAGKAWTVEIERSLDTPGCYRLKPYVEGNPSCPNLPEVADTYLYIHAEDAQKVYTSPFTILNKDGRGYKIEHRAVMTTDADEEYYGTLVDGVITFPAGSHEATVIGIEGMGSIPTNMSGKATIALPGSNFKDYYIEQIHSLCASSDGDGFCRIPLDIDCGADVTGAVLYFEAGNITPNPNKLEDYKKAGTEMDRSFFAFLRNMIFPIDRSLFKTNRWTLVTLALDAQKNVQNYNASTFFTPENASEWQAYGKGEFTDLFLGPSYSAVNEIMDVEIEQNIKEPGRFRIVNPYKDHPYFKIKDGCLAHDHHIYINATDPDFVYVEESPVGLDLGYGDIAVSSAAGAMLNEHATLEDVKYAGVAGGKMKNNIITFPNYSLYFFETKYENCKLQSSAGGELLRITETGVNAVMTESNGNVEYYDLNGIRIAEPQQGGLYLKKQGSKVTKEIIK